MSIKSRISSAYNKAKKAVSGVVSKVVSNLKAVPAVAKTNLSSPKAVVSSVKSRASEAANAIRSVIDSLSKAGPQTGNLSSLNSKTSTGGPTATVQYSSPIGPAEKPRTVTTTKKSSGGGVTTQSNYNYPSYSPDNIYNVPTGFSVPSAPREIKVTADTARVGGVSVPSPSAPSAPDYTSLAGVNPVTGTPVGGVAGGGVDTATPELTPEQQTAEAAFTDYVEGLKKPPKTANLYEKAQEESGLLEAQQRKNEIQNRINARTAQMQQAILAEEGRGEGAVLDVIGGRQEKIKREAAIDLMPMQAELAVAQGDLELASERLNTLFKIYTTDAENSVNFYNETKKLYYEFMTDTQKKKADAVSKEKDDLKATLTDYTNFHQQVWMEAYRDGNKALQSALSKVKPPVNTNSKTYRQDLANYLADIQAVAARYGTTTGVEGADAPLYSGLNSATATAVRGVVNGFKSEPIVTNFTQVQEGHNFSQSIPNNTTNPANDQALIYSLAKALDPGSVVREGEYATAQKYSQSWISAYGKSISQALNGTGFLSETARKNIKSTIETKYKSSLNSYNNLQSQYARQINNLTGRSNGSEFLRDYRVTITPEDEAQQNQSDVFDSVVSNSSGGYWSKLWAALKGK